MLIHMAGPVGELNVRPAEGKTASRAWQLTGVQLCWTSWLWWRWWSAADMIVQVRTWLGVPYATPPVAALRFRPPRPVLRASGKIDSNCVKENIGWIKIEKTWTVPFSIVTITISNTSSGWRPRSKTKIPVWELRCAQTKITVFIIFIPDPMVKMIIRDA